MARTAATVQAELDEVNTAISAVLVSQEYYTGSRRNRRADLRALRELKSDLINELSDLEGGASMASLAEFGDVR